jgi:hypothetical protein
MHGEDCARVSSADMIIMHALLGFHHGLEGLPKVASDGVPHALQGEHLDRFCF